MFKRTQNCLVTVKRVLSFGLFYYSLARFIRNESAKIIEQKLFAQPRNRAMRSKM